MFEHKSQPLASRKVYGHRLLRSVIYSCLLLAVCLFIGTVGFKWTCTHVEWIDAFHNASLLLSGMGPVLDASQMTTTAKLFSSFYSLFSGVAFITNIGILLAPAAHRIFHKLHIEND